MCYVKLVHDEFGEAPVCAALTLRDTIVIGRDFLAAINVLNAEPIGTPWKLNLDYRQLEWSMAPA